MKYFLLSLLFLLPITSFAQSQTEWINQLSLCESGGKSDITVLDTNNKYSYGEFQFQLGTFMGYGKQYGILPQSLTDEEGLLLIHNPYIQRALATMMLDNGLSYHWKNCSQSIGPYPLTKT